MQSPFVWRLFVFMALIALGFCLVLASAGNTAFAVAWGAIAAGWFGVGMWLWRRHIRYEDDLRRAEARRR